MGIFSKWKPVLNNEVEAEYLLWKQANVKQNQNEIIKKEKVNKCNVSERKIKMDYTIRLDTKFFLNEFKYWQSSCFIGRFMMISSFIFLLVYAALQVYIYS